MALKVLLSESCRTADHGREVLVSGGELHAWCFPWLVKYATPTFSFCRVQSLRNSQDTNEFVTAVFVAGK
jgi:hypothetical protein